MLCEAFPDLVSRLYPVWPDSLPSALYPSDATVHPLPQFHLIRNSLSALNEECIMFPCRLHNNVLQSSVYQPAYAAIILFSVLWQQASQFLHYLYPERSTQSTLFPSFSHYRCAQKGQFDDDIWIKLPNACSLYILRYISLHGSMQSSWLGISAMSITRPTTPRSWLDIQLSSLLACALLLDTPKLMTPWESDSGFMLEQMTCRVALRQSTVIYY